MITAWPPTWLLDDSDGAGSARRLLQEYRRELTGFWKRAPGPFSFAAEHPDARDSTIHHLRQE